MDERSFLPHELVYLLGSFLILCIFPYFSVDLACLFKAEQKNINRRIESTENTTKCNEFKKQLILWSSQFSIVIEIGKLISVFKTVGLEEQDVEKIGCSKQKQQT